MWEDTTLSPSNNIKLFAPHWTNVNFDAADTQVFFHFYSIDEDMRFDIAQQRLAESGLDTFDIESMVTVTWVNLLPKVQFDSTLDSVSRNIITILSNSDAYPSTARICIICGSLGQHFPIGHHVQSYTVSHCGHVLVRRPGLADVWVRASLHYR